MANPFLCDNRKRANVRYFEVKGRCSVRDGNPEIIVVTSQRDVSINNPFKKMCWENILLRDLQ